MGLTDLSCNFYQNCSRPLCSSLLLINESTINAYDDGHAPGVLDVQEAMPNKKESKPRLALHKKIVTSEVLQYYRGIHRK
jgi:hypothetical protein